MQKPVELTCKIADADQHFDGVEDTDKQGLRISVSDTGIAVYADGFGAFPFDDDIGAPVLIEFVGGHLRVAVWADIMQEDPTHVIDLDGAALETRGKPRRRTVTTTPTYDGGTHQVFRVEVGDASSEGK